VRLVNAVECVVYWHSLNSERHCVLMYTTVGKIRMQ